MKKEFGVTTLPWPANSPDLHPLDYSYWQQLMKKVGSTKSIEECIGRIIKAVNEMNAAWPDHQRAIQEWPSRVSTCWKAQGDHFEL